MDSNQRLKQLNAHFHAHREMNEQVTNPMESLQFYRSKSTINKQQYKELIYGRNWHFRDNLFKVVKENPNVFKHHHFEEYSRDEQRYHSFKAMVCFFQKLGLTYDQFMADPNIATMTSCAMYSYDPAVCIKFGVHFHLYGKTILNLGTEKHIQYLDRAKDLQDIGSFSLTEVGHGSNVRNVLTTAVYDKIKKVFVINTPNDLATKFWIGATANLANMTVVFAQLYIDEQHYGVHAFLVEIRNRNDHTIKNGVIIGDCGPKNGLNGIDNGFLIFKNLEVPLHSLLDKFSSVSEDGTFTTQIEDQDKRFAVQLGSLSGGRIVLSLYGAISSLNALAIGIRYAAIRKQFGMPGDMENSIIEYPLTQVRLMIPLASTLVYLIAGQAITQLWDSTQSVVFNPNQMAEVHAISSILKGQMAMFANKTILECRQILGGHGYHAFNRLGNMLQDQDINNTWEGDSNVLQQQTAKFLLDNYKKASKGKQVKYDSVKFLITTTTQGTTLFRDRDSLLNIPNLCRALEYRCKHLIEESQKQFDHNLSTESDLFAAWNKSLPFYLSHACQAYADVYCMQEWMKIKTDKLLDNAFRLWALSIIETDTAFRDNNYITQELLLIVRQIILELCAILKDESVGIIDALAPPDEVLGSVFGSSDGDIYNNYLNRIYSAKNTFSRVPWWSEVRNIVK